MSVQFRFVIGIGVFALLILGGMFAYSHFFLTQPNTNQQLGNGNIPIITEITLGTPLNAEEAKKSAPKLRQQSAYDINQPLALRVQLNPQIQSSIQVGVRLITEQGKIIELDPPTITLAPGASTFCCWQINQPNIYSMQIFRPEKTITSIPVTIRQSFTSNQDSVLKVF